MTFFSLSEWIMLNIVEMEKRMNLMWQTYANFSYTNWEITIIWNVTPKATYLRPYPSTISTTRPGSDDLCYSRGHYPCGPYPAWVHKLQLHVETPQNSLTNNGNGKWPLDWRWFDCRTSTLLPNEGNLEEFDQNCTMANGICVVGFESCMQIKTMYYVLYMF